MIRGGKSDSLPIDLIIEILSRVPAKSIARFSCVSKQWGSMFTRPYFTEMFLTRSSSRPRILFAVKIDFGDWRFFSSPQHQKHQYEKSSSLVLTADFHMKLPGNLCLEFCGYASGLIMSRLNTGVVVICNPSTRQFSPLRKQRLIRTRNYLGFDPTGKQFKLLSINCRPSSGNQILTLGTGHDWSRKIHSPLNHFPSPLLAEGVCINGVLYYLAEDIDGVTNMIVCFDVRSEKFQFINIDFIAGFPARVIKLINYKGKLGVITMKYYIGPSNIFGNMSILQLCMRVLKGVEKRESEWSEYVYTFRKKNGCYNVSTLWENQVFSCNCSNISIVGVTAEGEIVLLINDLSKPFCLFYLNPETNTLQRVDIQGLGAANDETFEKYSRRVRVFIDHVEDLKVY